MDLGLVPGNDLTIHPNVLCLLEGHSYSLRTIRLPTKTVPGLDAAPDQRRLTNQCALERRCPARSCLRELRLSVPRPAGSAVSDCESGSRFRLVIENARLHPAPQLLLR